MSKAKFLYVTYIATTPEKLWDALTNGKITRQYWDRENVSEWKNGSKWEHRRIDGSGIVDIVGKVLESTPPKRLVLTWALAADEDKKEKHSRVSFDLSPLPNAVRLTLTHEDLEPDSQMLRDCSQGWPAVLSSLKTFLEVGKPLPTW